MLHDVANWSDSNLDLVLSFIHLLIRIYAPIVTYFQGYSLAVVCESKGGGDAGEE